MTNTQVIFNKLELVFKHFRYVSKNSRKKLYPALEISQSYPNFNSKQQGIKETNRHKKYVPRNMN